MLVVQENSHYFKLRFVKKKVWYVVTVLVNTICNGILVSCVSVRGINVLIIKNTLVLLKKKKKKKSKNMCPFLWKF